MPFVDTAIYQSDGQIVKNDRLTVHVIRWRRSATSSLSFGTTTFPVSAAMLFIVVFRLEGRVVRILTLTRVALPSCHTDSNAQLAFLVSLIEPSQSLT